MEIHIGKKIKQIAKVKEIGPTKLSSIMKRSRTNVNNIFTRKSIDTDLLLELSKVLGFDFFRLFSDKLKSEPGQGQQSQPEDSLEVVKKQLEECRKSSEVLQKYIAVLENQISELKTKQKGRGS